MAEASKPCLGEPRLCAATHVTLTKAGIELVPQPPLPEFVELEDVFEGTPSDEPMVQPDGERLSIVPYYASGGWANAISECWLRASVAERLADASRALPEPFGLAVFDAWRPRELQMELHAAAEAEGCEPGLIAPPTTHPRHPAPHETGGAVDVTLTLDGLPLALGTQVDEMIPRAAAAALEPEPGVGREARRLLYWAMRTAGFVVYIEEWWHFEYGTRRWAAITGGTAVYATTTPPGNTGHVRPTRGAQIGGALASNPSEGGKRAG